MNQRRHWQECKMPSTCSQTSGTFSPARPAFTAAQSQFVTVSDQVHSACGLKGGGGLAIHVTTPVGCRNLCLGTQWSHDPLVGRPILIPIQPTKNLVPLFVCERDAYPFLCFPPFLRKTHNAHVWDCDNLKAVCKPFHGFLLVLKPSGHVASIFEGKHAALETEHGQCVVLGLLGDGE